MAYGSFAKWYVAKLKAKPLLVNLSSGFFLMSTGDVLAQRVEIRAKDRRKQTHENETAHSQQTTAAVEKSSEESFESFSQSAFLEATDAIYRAVKDEIASFGWDKSRTAKMAAWSFLFTPFYVGIFKMYDRYLPKKNLPSIAARVGCSFLCSIPINFAFYTYGTAIEHTAEWYEERQEQRALLLDRQKLRRERSQTTQQNRSQLTVDLPYRFDKLLEKTRQKLEAEFVTTIKTSACFWIPLNFLSFSVVPSHIQPVNIMFFSVFWNCYLSTSQHREIFPDGSKPKDE